jgi:hypothetical protein
VSNSQLLHDAWTDYHATQSRLRAEMEISNAFIGNPDQRARAYHGLIEAYAMAYNMVIAPVLNHPRVQTHTSWNTQIFTLGQNCADGWYGSLLLDGRQTYKLTGRLGAVKITLMQVFGNMLGQPDAHEIAEHDFASFSVDANGRYEVTISATKQPGNWIALNPDSHFNFILLRRFIGDWFDDVGEMTIAPVAGSPRLDEHSDEAMAERIRLASGFAVYLVREWNIKLYDLFIAKAGGKNRLGYFGGNTISDLAGSPANNYTLGIAEIAPDEAIIVEQEVPDAAYWSWQIGDVWTKGLDIMNYQTDINMNRAVIDADGRFRAVIAPRDPGVPNWLNSRGFTEININGRNYRERGEKRIAAPTMKTVKFDDLHRHLPKGTPRITPAERAAALERRRRGYLRLYDNAGPR